MKKIVLMIVTLVLANSASATQMLVKVLQESEAVSTNVIKEVPITSCRVEEVPIYSTQQEGDAVPSVADKAAGAIFGGLLGNQVGDGKGKDAATLLGAIIGAEMVEGQVGRTQKERVITGYRQQEVCEKVLQQKNIKETVGYKTYIEFGGQIWQLQTPIPYSSGDFVRVNVNITMAD